MEVLRKGVAGEKEKLQEEHKKDLENLKKQHEESDKLRHLSVDEKDKLIQELQKSLDSLKMDH